MIIDNDTFTKLTDITSYNKFIDKYKKSESIIVTDCFASDIIELIDYGTSPDIILNKIKIKNEDTIV